MIPLEELEVCKETDLLERKLISYFKLINGYTKSIGTKSAEDSNNDQ
jgi:hypothetical protein